MFFISYGACFSYPTGPVQVCRTAPVWTGKGIDKTGIGKNPARASYLAVRAPYHPRMGCSRADYNLNTDTGPVNL